jgi:uncharacterized protein (TIGR03118 family)
MKRLLLLAWTTAGIALGAPPARSTTLFVVTPLVTDASDSDLVNPWGVSSSATSPFWVSDNGTGKATLYSVDPTTNATSKVGLTVAIPGAGNVTGQAFNGAAASLQFGGDSFLFAGEDGTISGWRAALGTTAETLQLPSSDNVYKGAAFATIGGEAYLYAANFKQGRIDVLPGSASAPPLAGTFLDPNLPSGYSPFNIVHLGDSLFVSYAVQDQAKVEDVPGAGHGIVDEFSLQGVLVRRFASGGSLDSPWGIAVAPASFGSYAGDLLVGNLGDGTINAFEFLSAGFVGQLADGSGQPIAIDGLWSLISGNDGNAGDSQSIYFSAGPGGGVHGVFGVLEPVPEPATGLLAAVGLALLPLARRRGRA